MPVYGEDEYEFTRFVGHPDTPSPFRGPPSPAVDEMWNSLWADNMLISEREYALSQPRDRQAGVYGVSSTSQGFFATFESTHQLHCLYNLFRASYVDYYKPERKFLLHNPEKYHARLDHCTEILRQKLMCDADASIVTYAWGNDTESYEADFSVLHQCRNYETLLDWSRKHSATGAVFTRD
ncbi:hypothetical protein BO82DRAFT_400190 [Aspergillus uvarum CBS 121591]|uniref:Cyclochlorotine biosynthesis protein O n=1 Tax=Aspergillus uvarum CBS 121591 TaxID=1448315 RepID=A0A319CH69_9EURO|nr:hypothetical protein BO82DRAFT_400190 [Aspergillus uvarum CBS 121591]PYH83790.1 hypothetical protein BO82DRAFT_400190 [Aspergillus uvarum CBS 121591]